MVRAPPVRAPAVRVEAADRCRGERGYAGGFPAAVLLLGVLAKSLGGTAALQTFLGRTGGKRRHRGAPFHLNG